MRENRTYGSEGGETGLSYPYPCPTAPNNCSRTDTEVDALAILPTSRMLS